MHWDQPPWFLMRHSCCIADSSSTGTADHHSRQPCNSKGRGNSRPQQSESTHSTQSWSVSQPNVVSHQTSLPIQLWLDDKRLTPDRYNSAIRNNLLARHIENWRHKLWSRLDKKWLIRMADHLPPSSQRIIHMNQLVQASGKSETSLHIRIKSSCFK